MLEIQKYVQASSLEEAYALLQKNRNNLILGGMMWLRMQKRVVPCAIDITALQLEGIKEETDVIEIGAMTTLRTIETSPLLKQYYGNLLQDCVKDIVGVQFRNGATIGGSVYARFGFSDILTALSVLDAQVVLHHQGCIPICDYIEMPYERDIIKCIRIPKQTMQTAYYAVRRSKTDLPVINSAMAIKEDTIRIAIGSRPKQAKRYLFAKDAQVEEIIETLQKEVEVEDNMRGSGEYRRKLIKGCILHLWKQREEEEAC